MRINILLHFAPFCTCLNSDNLIRDIETEDFIVRSHVNDNIILIVCMSSLAMSASSDTYFFSCFLSFLDDSLQLLGTICIIHSLYFFWLDTSYVAEYKRIEFFKQTII